MAKTFGPGLMFACTAIGVSHLVQSTRAGAEFGLALVGFVVLANLLKYPFYEFSSRYTNATGTSLIDGYLRLGRPFLLLYFAVTVGSMFFVTGAVGFVTAGFMENLFSVSHLGDWTLVILFAVCCAILVFGRYTLLDGLIKIVAAVLVISTLLAFAIAIHGGPATPVPGFEAPELLTGASVLFIIALMGWMPMPIDTATWHSLWTLERIKQTRFVPRMRATLADFNLGYAITALLAVVFVVLGAYIFYGSGEDLPNNNSLFAASFVDIYTVTMGQWSGIVISASAFSVMFGTIVAVLDGYSRSLSRMTTMIRDIANCKKDSSVKSTRARHDMHSLGADSNRHKWNAGGDDDGDILHHNYDSDLDCNDSSGVRRTHKDIDAHHDDSKGIRYPLYAILLAAGSIVTVTLFGDRLREFVDFASILSFLIAPIIAIFNFRLVTGRYLARSMQPPLWLRALACAGIAFLCGFAVFFLLVRTGIITL